MHPRGFEAGTSGFVSKLGHHSATRDLLFDMKQNNIYWILKFFIILNKNNIIFFKIIKLVKFFIFNIFTFKYCIHFI